MIIVTGYSFTGGTEYDFTTAEYSPDGVLNTDFGTGGIVVTDIGTTDFANGITAQQADGKIIVVGSANVSGNRFALVRYNTDGTLDSSFGSGGVVTTVITGSSASEIGAIALQTNGKIVVAGDATIGGNRKIALARYDANGSLDASFGSGGMVTTTVSTHAAARAILIQPDGQIVIGGQSGTSFFSPPQNFTLARYNSSDGSIDTSFGTSGITVTNFGENADQIWAMVLQSDNKIIAGGWVNLTSPTTSYDWALARYNTNGTIDTSYGTSGKVMTTFTGLERAEMFGLAIQPDDFVVGAGVASSTAILDYKAALARYDTDGNLDSSFGTGGKVTAAPGLRQQYITVARQSDGKLVTGGYTEIAGSNDFVIARYNTNGTLDTSFGTSSGYTITNIGSSDDVINSLILFAQDISEDIHSFSPPIGSVGGTIVICGQNLTTTTNITFNGTEATFAVVGESLSVIIPDGATSGSIVVTTPIGAATIQNYIITPPYAIQLTLLNS